MQSKIVFKIKGHESFTVREGWLQKGMRAVANDPLVFTKYAGADALGVGTNMAKSIRYWLKAFQLTEDQGKKGVVLTPFGRLLWEQDPYLEQRMTWWLLHSMLVCNRELATSWYLFFNQMQVNQMEREEAEAALFYEMERYTQGQTFSAKTVKDDCAAILHMYVRSKEREYDPEDTTRSPFADLGLLELEGRKIVCKTPAPEELPVEVIYDVLLRQAEGSQYLLLDQVIEGIDSPGRLFFLNRARLYDALLVLQNRKLLTINRTAGLDMIYFPGIVSKEMEAVFLQQTYLHGVCRSV